MREFLDKFFHSSKFRLCVGQAAQFMACAHCPVSGRFSTANFIDLDRTYSVNSELS